MTPDDLDKKQRDKEWNNINLIVGQIAEHYPDYLVIVRHRTGRGYIRRTSNGEWAYGICRQFINEIDANLARREELDVEREGE